MTDVIAIEKDGGAFWLDSNLQLGGYIGSLCARKQLHTHLDFLQLAGFDDEVARELGIACLADNNLMFAREQQDFLVALELLHVADISAVDPHAGIPIQLRIAFKADFAHDFAALRGDDGCAEREQKQREQSRCGLEVPLFEHDAPSHSGREIILTRMRSRCLQKRRRPGRKIWRQILEGADTPFSPALVIKWTP